METSQAAQIILHFSTKNGAPCLIKTEFIYPIFGIVQRCIRGKDTTLKGFGTFQWTVAVRALADLLLRTAIDAFNPTSASRLGPLMGSTGSEAVALDNALIKPPLWLVDIFGVVPRGKGRLVPFAPSLFDVRNQGRRLWDGPVVISFRTDIIDAKAIEVLLDGCCITDKTELEALHSSLAATHRPSKRSFEDQGEQVAKDDF